MTTLVTCPNGHRFPVNLKKHKNRKDRLCPKCLASVTIRKRFSFRPNPNWNQQKKENQALQKQLRRMGKKQPAPTPIETQLGRLPLEFLATLLSREKELEKGEKESDS